ncbi:hypothetical protein SETIT_1G072800v2 [Setaria italica]|uniref:Uncharacterized protein n=1 Tax=Setaria italica TaxID=4555 RepID=A0A368PIJ3_SETIT|nr:hypothetical protein SETIT_1G072800v2 [Setaria italica]
MADRWRHGVSPDTWDGTWEGEILDIIYGHYKEALDLLPLEDKPELAPHLLDAGVCFGFANPVTNIIANTLSFREPDPNGGAKRRNKCECKPKTNASEEAKSREEVLSKIIAGGADYWDVVRYLSLARADLLIAVSLIQKDRCYRSKDRFRVRSPAVKTALKRPDKPMDLVAKWFHDPEPEITASINENVPGELTESLRKVLMDRVHEHYLKAASRFPMKDLQIHHHCGLLKAGYCFSPFDPVSNIIVNTVWYDTAFPPSEEFQEDMICTLKHVEPRSANGLMAFVRPCSPVISEHKAMVYLLKSNLDVIRMAKREECDVSICDNKGYKATAEAAYHPNPEAYCEFVMQSLPAGCYYDLGVICGVNDSTHANFWASQDNGTNTLFFAEFSNDEDSNYELICYPVCGLPTQVRCYYCEYQGIRIVHPIENCWEGINGFEKIACGVQYFTNTEIVSRLKLIDNHPAHDAKLIQAVNKAVWVMNLDMDAEMSRIKSKPAAGH